MVIASSMRRQEFLGGATEHAQHSSRVALHSGPTFFCLFHNLIVLPVGPKTPDRNILHGRERQIPEATPTLDGQSRAGGTTAMKPFLGLLRTPACIVNRSGTILESNKACDRLFSHAPASAVSRYLGEFLALERDLLDEFLYRASVKVDLVSAAVQVIGYAKTCVMELCALPVQLEQTYVFVSFDTQAPNESATVVLDGEGRILTVDDVFVTAADKPESELVGADIRSVMQPIELSALADCWNGTVDATTWRRLSRGLFRLQGRTLSVRFVPSGAICVLSCSFVGSARAAIRSDNTTPSGSHSRSSGRSSPSDLRSGMQPLSVVAAAASAADMGSGSVSLRAEEEREHAAWLQEAFYRLPMMIGANDEDLRVCMCVNDDRSLSSLRRSDHARQVEP
jgi:PAS domain-containing protein